MAKEIATFAGGCFWCMVKPFDSQPGIESVVSGYTGGHKENPTYKEVCSGTTGHTEAVQITFDPEVFPYEKLVEVYWQQTDPTDAMGPRRFLSPSHLLSLRRTKKDCGSFKSSLASQRTIQKRYRDKNRACKYVLSCRRISPRFLQEGSRTL